MFDEVSKEKLSEDLEQVIEAGLHLTTLGENLLERARAIQGAVETMAVAIPAEGIDSLHVPLVLFNQICEALKRLVELTADERLNPSRKYVLARKILNDLLDAGLRPLLPPEPELSEEELRRKVVQEEIRARDLRAILK
jgi:hypothetical protein